MKLLHFGLMCMGVGVLWYSLNPKHWKSTKTFELNSAQICQILVRKERK
jgi:hypothetical protein